MSYETLRSTFCPELEINTFIQGLQNTQVNFPTRFDFEVLSEQINVVATPYTNTSIERTTRIGLNPKSPPGFLTIKNNNELTITRKTNFYLELHFSLRKNNKQKAESILQFPSKDWPSLRHFFSIDENPFLFSRILFLCCAKNIEDMSFLPDPEDWTQNYYQDEAIF